MSSMTTFELTATVPATTNIHGEPGGSYTGNGMDDVANFSQYILGSDQ